MFLRFDTQQSPFFKNPCGGEAGKAPEDFAEAPFFTIGGTAAASGCVHPDVEQVPAVFICRKAQQFYQREDGLERVADSRGVHDRSPVRSLPKNPNGIPLASELSRQS